MASAQFLEKALSSDVDETEMSAIVGSLETQQLITTTTPKVTVDPSNSTLVLSTAIVSSSSEVITTQSQSKTSYSHLTTDVVHTNHLSALDTNKNPLGATTATAPINGIPLAVTANIDITKVPPSRTTNADPPPSPSMSMTVHLFNSHTSGVPPSPMPVTTNVPVTGVSGANLGAGTATGHPTFINANSGFQIVNMNALRASMQGVTGSVTGNQGNVQAVSAQGGPKTLTPRMILSPHPQVIGARPRQPGVHDCPSEFIKNSNIDNMKESSDSNIDAFDTKNYDDGIPTRIEDKEEIVISPPVELPSANPNQSPAQGDGSEVLCLGEVKHQTIHSKSLVYPYPKDTTIEPTEFVSCEPNIMASQARFQSGNSQSISPILNLDEHSHSDIIIFNSTQNSTTIDCVQTLDKDGQCQSELIVIQKDSGSSDNFNKNEGNHINANFDCTSDVQIINGLRPISKSTSPTQPSQLSPNSFQNFEVERTSPNLTGEANDASRLHRQEQFNQNHSRQSILVPNIKNITAQPKLQSSDALVQHHNIPSTTLAQPIQWTRRTISASASELTSPTRSEPTLHEHRSVHGQEIQSSNEPHLDRLPDPRLQLQASSATNSPHIASVSQSHARVPQISPNSQPQLHSPRFLPTSQSHSLITRPHSIAPQFSPTSQPRSQVPQFSPTSQHPAQVPQFSPGSQLRQHFSHNTQPHQQSPRFATGVQSYPNDPQFSPTHHHPYGHHFSASSKLPHPQVLLQSPTSQRQMHGPFFPSSQPLRSGQLSQLHHHTPNFTTPSQPNLGSSRQFSPTKTSHSFSPESEGAHRPGPISPQHSNVAPKCFTTDAQLQSQYLHYNQTHPLTVQVNKSVTSSPTSPPGSAYSGPTLIGGSAPSHPKSANFRSPTSPTGVHIYHPAILPISDQPLLAQPPYSLGSGQALTTSTRSHPHAPHPYDLQARHIRPNLQHSQANLAPMPYNNQSTSRWVTHSLVRNSGTGPVRGISLQDTSQGHGHAQNKLYSTEHPQQSTNPNLSGTGRAQAPPYGRPSNNPNHLFVAYPPERLIHSNFSQANLNSSSHSIGGGRGTVRPIAHQSSTYAQYSSQYNQYRPEGDSSSHIFYQGQSHGVPNNSQTQIGSTSSSGSYPVICRVSPIRNRLENDLKTSPPYHHLPYHKIPPGPTLSQEYCIGPRMQGTEYNLCQHEQYIETMRRLSTQFTLQALPGLPPGAQGGHHLLVKTESGQFQLLRFGMPAPALTAATGTPLPHPPSSPLAVSNSVSPSPCSPSVVTTTTTSNTQLPSSPSASAPNTFAANSSNSLATTTILGGLVQSQQVVVSQAPLPGPVSFTSNVNFMSTISSPRPPVVVSSSTSSNSSNTIVSNSSIPSQVSTGSPALATTTTTYRLQTVPPVPPTAASNSSGVGMTASMSMQQQMHLPQVSPHSQAPPSQAPSSVLTSTNTSTTSTTATTVSQMTPDTAKTKCKNFLSFLLELSAKQNQTVARNVKTLIQGLVDGKVNAEDFSDRLQKEVNSQPQPCLVGFLKKSLPPLRHSLATKELTIEGIRAPILTSMPSGVPAAPVTALIPQNQVRSPSVPTTPVRIITPINSTPPPLPLPLPLPLPPPPQPTNISSAPIPRSTVAAVQQRFASPSKSSPSSKASKSNSSASSPNTQSFPSTFKASGPSSSKSTTKEKGDKKGFASNAGYSGDDDINDVAAMGGVNLAEESQRILGSTELIGTQIRSCKDEVFLPVIPLQSKIKSIAAKHGLDEPSPEVAAMISHALEERLKTLLEKLSVIAEHRLDVIKLEDRYEVSQDVKGQLRFLEELDKLERKRHDEQEREMLIRAAKSRSKSEDPEQAKLKAKAKEMQRVALEEMRQREANMTALQAIGPRKKPKLDTASGSQSTTPQTSQSSLGASNSLNRPQMSMRPRLKRVSLRDLLFLLEQEKETTRSHFLYKHLLLK